MADEPEEEQEGGWNPEEERVPGELQKEYLKLIKNMNEQAEEAKRREAKEREKPEPPSPTPLFALLGVPAKQPTYDEMVTMCKRAWEDTKKASPQAPEGVKVLMFSTLLNHLIRGLHDDLA
jgi:hypothetical protein